MGNPSSRTLRVNRGNNRAVVFQFKEHAFAFVQLDEKKNTGLTFRINLKLLAVCTAYH